MPPLVAVRVERDNGIDGFPIAGVVLAHGDEAARSGSKITSA